MTAHTAALEAAREAMRQHVKCDATGLSPAVASVFLTGFDDAARAAIVAFLREVGVSELPISVTQSGGEVLLDEHAAPWLASDVFRAMLRALADEVENRIPAP